MRVAHVCYLHFGVPTSVLYTVDLGLKMVWFHLHLSHPDSRKLVE